MALVKLTIPSLDKTYAIDFEKLSYEEIETMEDQIDITFGEFTRLLQRGSIKGTKILLWIAMKRDNPVLEFKNVAFEIYDFEFEAPEAPEEPVPNRAARRAQRPKDEPKKLEIADSIISGS